MKVLACSLLATLGAACGGTPSGATCPTSNAPTYLSFGQQFFTTYCNTCHSASAPNRHDAPADQNYDSESQIRAHADDIDQSAAAGPTNTNTSMPDVSGPAHNRPTLQQRVLLGQFLACEKAGKDASRLDNAYAR